MKNTFKKNVLELLNKLNIKSFQKKEIGDYIISDLKNSKKDISDLNEKKYLNNILKAYGINYYNRIIIIKSIMNFILANVIYLFIKSFNNTNTIVKGNIKILIIIGYITLIIMPLMKLVIRKLLLNLKSGFSIIKKLGLYFIISFFIAFIIYKIPISKKFIDINVKTINIIGLIIFLVGYIYNKQIKFILVQNKKEIKNNKARVT